MPSPLARTRGRAEAEAPGRRTALAGLLAAGCLFAGCASTAPRRASSRLDGTVVQFTPAHNLYTRGDWTRLLQALRALGMTRIVVQWSVDGTTAYYPSRHFRIGPMPPLETLLDLALAGPDAAAVG